MILASAGSIAIAQGPTGSIAGSVLDSQNGRPIAGVRIAVNGIEDDRHVTDSDGRFLISLAPGAYDLRYTAANYLQSSIASVIVKAGESTEASTIMTSQSAAVTSVEVTASADAVGATAEALLNERKLAGSLSDSISREELAGGTSSNAAGALEKVTGVSVVGDGFVYVRGLGERYSASMLNGAMIPTTEPEKRVVPLDLFPTGLIENIRIIKTYTPDIPAEFAGGLVQLNTIEFPAKRSLKFDVKAGFNTTTTFNRFLTYPGGQFDFFGFDDGTRVLPSQIPAVRVIAGAFPASQIQALGRSFSDNWQPTTINSIRPDVSWSVAGGGTFGPLGIVGAFSFENKPRTQSELQNYYRQGGNGPIVFTTYPDFREYSQAARLGGVFNAALRLTPNHKLVFRNTLTHDTENTAREFDGYDGGVDSNIESQRLRWVERSLFSTGVEGDHSLPNWRNSLIRWQFTYSRATRYEPDLREVFRGLLPNGTQPFLGFGSSGIRFFSDLHDEIYEPQVDYSVPFFKGAITGLFKTGFRATVRRRDFAARRFIFSPQRLTTLDLFAPSNVLFAADNIRPDGFILTEFTRGTDSYNASMDVYASYAMVDLSLGGKWRVVGGIRFESSDINVVTIDNRVPNAVPVLANLANTDPAPGVNLIYALKPRQNLRFSYSRTLSRPDFRELSPFDFNNVLGGFVTQGNPNLKRAVINNFDARWELFPGGNQVIAASFFAKTFQDPIEQTILPSNDLRQTFNNAKGAQNIGVELEFRRSLTWINHRLRDWAMSSNFTYVHSQIDIRPEDATVITSASRPLLGQSCCIFNGIVEWAKPRWRSDARFYANYVSRRISDVGTFRLPDIYQESNTLLDFVYELNLTESRKWSLRFEAENLGDNDYRWSQGGLVQRDYHLGRTFQIGLTYAVF